MNLREYVKPRGRAAKLARDMEVSQVIVSQWATGQRPIPPERCAQIELATSGMVTRKELRPEIFAEDLAAFASAS